MTIYQAIDSADLTMEQFKDKFLELIVYNFREHTLIMCAILIIFILSPLLLISYYGYAKELEQKFKELEQKWEKEKDER